MHRRPNGVGARAGGTAHRPLAAVRAAQRVPAGCPHSAGGWRGSRQGNCGVPELARYASPRSLVAGAAMVSLRAAKTTIQSLRGDWGVEGRIGALEAGKAGEARAQGVACGGLRANSCLRRWDGALHQPGVIGWAGGAVGALHCALGGAARARPCARHEAWRPSPRSPSFLAQPPTGGPSHQRGGSTMGERGGGGVCMAGGAGCAGQPHHAPPLLPLMLQPRSRRTSCAPRARPTSWLRCARPMPPRGSSGPRTPPAGAP